MPSQSKRPRLQRLVAELRALRRRQGRRVWRGAERLHIGLREILPEELPALAPAFEQALGQRRGVAWARLQPELGALVLQLRPRAVRARRGESHEAAQQRFEDELIAAVAQVEAEHALERRRFPVVAHPEQHPGDWLPLARTLLELGLDAGSIAGGFVLRRTGVKALPVEIDLLALQNLVRNTPKVRKFVERRLTIALTEVGLELSGAVLQSLVHGEFGAAVNTLHRSLRLRELAARRRLWRQWEPRLCTGRRTPPEDIGSRPRRLPDGPIERYSDKASMGSMLAFAGTLFATGRLEDSTAAIFAGMPRSARLGRQSFAAHLGWRLAQHGVMVMEPHILRQLDRLDCVALPEALLDEDAQGAQRLLEAIRDAGLHCVISGCESAARGGAGSTRHLPLQGAAAVRALQAEEHGVMYIGRGDSGGYAASDCGLALWRDGEDAAAGAHLYCEGGLAQAAAMVEAVAAARKASEHALNLSLGVAVLAIALSSQGLEDGTMKRIVHAASATAVLAIADGLRLAHSVRWHGEEPAEAPPPPWHRMSAEEVMAALDSSERGLSEQAAAARRLPAPERSRLQHLGRVLGEELRNPMTPVLAAGAALSLVSGGAVDAALVASVLALNAVYGGAQRYRTDQLLSQLTQRDRQCVRVRRGAGTNQVDEVDLVPGDVVELSAGEVVPADCRILEAHNLEADESSITGESMPIAKSAQASEAANLGDRHSMLYAGSVVAAGEAVALVVATGKATEVGRAAAQQPISTVSTGVEARLESLTRLTVPVAAASGLVLAAAERLRRRPMNRVMSTAVSLAVAAVPEGLPLLAGLAQLTVAGRLSRRGALVRNPRAIEALGRVNLLCADKTGTLTEGQIRLVRVSDGRQDWALDQLTPAARGILAVALRASPSSSNGARLAHMTDRALVEGAHGMEVRSHDGLKDWQRLHEMPFESSRGYHAGLAEHGDGKLISVKGAPEVVLDRCSHWQRDGRRSKLGKAAREQLRRESIALADRGYRVLAVAERSAHEQRPVDPERIAKLDFHGFVAFADPVRPSAREAVAELQRAGIEIVMLTGDHPHTAAAIAKDLGLDGQRRVVTGAEIEQLSDEQLLALAPETSVFARVTPAHKVRIVKAFQKCGKTVGMTGDGANDAPAIRLADVGIALGESSTSAARNAADMIVTDGRIETILAAVIEGRALWQSVREAVSLLVGGNLGEISFTLLGGLAGEVPLNARQLLLVNLFTDTIPALAVALRPPSASAPEALLQAGPEASLGKDLIDDIGWHAAATTAAATAAWAAARRFGNRRKAGTVGLVALTGAQILQALAAGRGDRSVRLSSLGSMALLLAIVETPGLSHFFGCRPLGPIGLFQAGVAAAAGGSAQRVLPRWWQRLRARRGSDSRAGEPAGTAAPRDGRAGKKSAAPAGAPWRGGAAPRALRKPAAAAEAPASRRRRPRKARA